MKTTWNRIRKGEIEETLALANAGYRCEGKTLPGSGRCTEPAVEVVQFRDDGPYQRAALCVACRKKCFGLLGPEKAAATGAHRGKQVPMFDAAVTAPRHRDDSR
jgi:hypothetical protein